MFIAPDKKQIDATFALGVRTIELHTGAYAIAFANRLAAKEFAQIKAMTFYASQKRMVVNAGRQLWEYLRNCRVKGMNELNIGHAIVSRAVFVGLKQAVNEMLAIIKRWQSPFYNAKGDSHLFIWS